MTTATASRAGPTTLEQFEQGVPGIYRDIPFEDYLRCRLMSQSVLKQGRASMLHLKYAMDHPPEPTDAMILGSALHTAFLEPSLMPEKVAAWTGPRRAGKEWNEFKQEHAGKAILTPCMYAKLTGMIEALRQHPDVRRWLGRIQATEVSAVGTIEGVRFKGRADALTDDPLWDLKKTSTTDDRTIASTIETYGYHIQAHVYRELFGRERFCFGFVEEFPPHDVRVVELSETWLRMGRAEAVALIQRFKLAQECNLWPGRSGKIDVMEPPAWVLDRSGASDITLGGESVFGKEQ